MAAGRRGYYATLGVSTTATQREIKAAFRRLARETHPDRQAGRDAAEGDEALERRFKRIARAYAVVGDPVRRKAYDERLTRGRFAAPGTAGPATYIIDTGPLYHSDLGHHSDFYQAGDPMTVAEAANLTRRDPGWLRRAIRSGRLRATRGPGGYLLRRRDAERLDRTAGRRSRRIEVVAEGPDLNTTTE